LAQENTGPQRRFDLDQFRSLRTRYAACDTRSRGNMFAVAVSSQMIEPAIR
jgi:hypothetical protein